MPRPLSHIRVLDMTRVLAGPWASQNLADLGAEVIKVERPGTGDDTRTWGPPWLKDRAGAPTREAAYFLSVNRGKKSIAIDIASARGQELVRALAARSDVVMENYKVGDLARYGLAYDDIRAVNPGVVYCSVTGFGQSGPYAARPGYDFVFQGMGGLMSITGERDDRPGGGPQKVGIAVTDVITGMYAALAVTAALTHRQAYGVGQYIDMALLDSIIAFNANQILNFWISGNVPRRWGNAHINIAPYEVFPTADGHIILAVGNDSQFASFCRVAGQPGLSADPRFRTNPSRVEHREELVAIVADLLRTGTSAHWIAALEAANVPCGPINDMRQVFEDSQVRHRGMRVDIDHPLAGTVPGVANPMRFSDTPVEYGRAPPLLGQHTEEVLRGVLDLPPAEIERLRREGVIGAWGGGASTTA
jgi:crotonobetainyl-CoA:carnitine CoA-transferase CaiB-like acyl-CoA transferase